MHPLEALRGRICSLPLPASDGFQGIPVFLTQSSISPVSASLSIFFHSCLLKLPPPLSNKDKCDCTELTQITQINSSSSLFSNFIRVSLPFQARFDFTNKVRLHRPSIQNMIYLGPPFSSLYHLCFLKKITCKYLPAD